MTEPLTYQEMLRTLGALLDQTGSQTATLGVSPAGARVSAPGWPWPQHWEAEALRAQAAWQRSLRLHARTRKAARAGRLSQRLRVVGAALDIDAAGPYLVTVEADHVQVEGRDGYQRTFAARSMQRRLRLAPHLRGNLPS
jgi:hypothetical protein